MAKFSLPHAPAPRAYGILAPPIPRPLDLVADDVVDPIGGDEEDPVCVLCSRGYLKGLVLCQPLRDLRESILGFVQAFVDSIQHSSGGGGLIDARSSTGAWERPVVVRCIASLWWACSPGLTNHTITLYATLLSSCVGRLLCGIVNLARIAPAQRTTNSLRSSA